MAKVKKTIYTGKRKETVLVEKEKNVDKSASPKREQPRDDSRKA